MKTECKLFPISYMAAPAKKVKFASMFLFGLVAMLVALGAALPATASDIYVAQSATGNATGANCGDAKAYSFFNIPSNWGTGVGQIGAGTTIHVCGMITGSAGATAFTFQGGGVSGSPITLLFEAGAVLSSPWWSVSGAINTNGNAWLVVDGGANGLIQNTANGTFLENKQTSQGVRAANCNNCAIKNLTIANIYIHSSVSDSSIDQANMNCIMAYPASNFTADHNVCHDAGWALNMHGDNVTISNNDVYNVDHGIAFGPNGTTVNTLIFGNHFHDYSNWDTSNNAYHHDGVHMWGQNGGVVTNCQIYDNRFDGDPGVNTTGHIFLEQTVKNCLIFNNVMVNTSAHTINCVWLQGYSPSNGASGQQVYNNFINCGPSNGNNVVGVQFLSQANFTFKNNVVVRGWELVFVDGGSSPAANGIDYNEYEDLSLAGAGSNAFSWKTNNTASFARWQSDCTCDSHSIFGSLASLNLSVLSGQLNLNILSANSGSNLTGLGIIALDSDFNGVARPSSGAWAPGPFASGNSAGRPAPPTNLSVVVQ